MLKLRKITENDFILMYKNWDMKILWPNFFGGQDIIGKSFGFAHTRKKKGLEIRKLGL